MSGGVKCISNSELFDVHKRLLQCYESKNTDNNLTKYDEFFLRKNHKFLWQSEESNLSWEEELARKYYNKLFKEFCICDLSKYKENKVALRWRTKNEVISGKGQFVCAEKKCDVNEHLRTWEVNFCYIEKEEKKNALVKVKLCVDCSARLNFHCKKREVKRLKRKSNHFVKEQQGGSSNTVEEPVLRNESQQSSLSKSIESDNLPWTQNVEIEAKSRDEEMEEYLNDLLF